MKRLICSLFFVLLPMVSIAQPVDIIDLHANDSNGIPDIPYTMPITITGIVTVPSDVYTDQRTEVYIQDATAGINVFSFDTPVTYALGDSVVVTGEIDQYNGTTELIPSEATIVSSGNTVPEPMVMTCQEVADSFFPDFSEPNEGRLIRINNVTFDPDEGMISDDSGTCMMYIDPDTGIENPMGEFSVIGILKQYDPSEPYTDGYEILPRYPTDIIYGEGPQIVTGPYESDIQADGVTFYWETDEPCGSTIRWGETTAYELGEINYDNFTTTHEVLIPDLESATIYHCQVSASGDGGTTNSFDVVFSTASAQSSGEVQVYFSKSVDTAYSSGTDAVTANLSSQFSQLIDQAEHSIDVCFYNISRQGIATDLVAAFNDGIDVRVIYEEEYHNEQIQYLMDNGVPVLNEDDSGHFMHNKFAVFDYGDDDETNDRVWTGSWNASFSGTYNNAEHAVVVQDAALAGAYTLEFEEMWAGNFSTDKTDNTPHRFNINGMPVRLYFSPTDGNDLRLRTAINTADHDIFFSIYSFTLNSVSDAMQSRYFEGINVRGVFDEGQSDGLGSEWDFMSGWADVHLDDVDGGGFALLHHKYLMVDPFYPDSDPVLMTGSYNWSVSATQNHDENSIYFYDMTVANIFFQEFMARYHEAGGEWDYLDIEDDDAETTIIPEPRLIQNYPNPFQPGKSGQHTTAIQFQLDRPAQVELSIYNLAGQKVRALMSGQKDMGSHQVSWDGTNQAGQALAAGVYFYRLEIESAPDSAQELTRRLVLMR